MATLVLLGTGSAVSDPHRTTTMLAFEKDGRSLLVDCGGDVIQRALQAEIDPDGIDGIIVTHEHPDHVSGFPLLISKLWLLGRRRPIDIYGIDRAISQARRSFATYDVGRWDLPELRWHEVDLGPNAEVGTIAGFHVSASPGVHSVPVVGLRVTCIDSGNSVTYSCDTEPCDSIAHLATGSSLLVHEANGALRGHTSIDDAARVAEKAGVARLVLVHLPPGLGDQDLQHARTIIDDVVLGDELDRFQF